MLAFHSVRVLTVLPNVFQGKDSQFVSLSYVFVLHLLAKGTSFNERLSSPEKSNYTNKYIEHVCSLVQQAY